MATKEWFEKQFADYENGDGWGIRWRASQSIRYDYILNFIKKYVSDSDAKVLEVGCGFGDFTFKFLRNYSHSKIFGIDISHNAIKEINRLIPRGGFEQAALPDIPFEDESFDGIMAMEVIYYLNNRQREESIKNIHKKLKKNGWFLFTAVIDNGESYFTYKSAVGLISKYFEIRAIDFNRAKLYRPLEILLLKIIHLKTFLQSPGKASDYKDSKFMKRLVCKISDNYLSRNLFVFLYQPVYLLAMKLLGLKFIPRLGNEIGKKLLPNSSKTNIMVYAVKK